jgi:2-dehydropantoate 2-reductase
MNIGVIGIGGVGGYFGGKICRSMSAPEANIYFVARGRHLAAIQQNGLSVSTAQEGDWVCYPALATDDIEALPKLDVCLICVKSYDLKSVVRQLQGKLSPSSAVVPLLNGIDIYNRIREDLNIAQVFPSCVYIGTHITDNGKVVQKGGGCKILIGKDPKATNAISPQLLHLFKKSCIQYECMDDVTPALWTKYIFIAAFGLVTASFDKTLGETMDSSLLSNCVLGVMGEIVALAEKMGVVLPKGIISESYAKGRDFPCEAKTSFQRDVDLADKLDERDLFGGTILRLGLQLGVATPITLELWGKQMQRKPL